MNGTIANADRECWIANHIGVYSRRRGLVQLLDSGLSDDEYRAQGWNEIEDPLVDGHGKGAVRSVRAENVFDSKDDALKRHYVRAVNYAMGPGMVPLTQRTTCRESW
jgi:hypothetical protein